MQLTETDRQLLAECRVGHLATVDEAGRPHVVPVCFAWHADALCTPIDEKPKRSPGAPLRRVLNIQSNPWVCFTVDRYDEDWQRLAWVQLRGPAEVIETGAQHVAAIQALRRRYPQYHAMRLEERPMIRLIPELVRSWYATPRRSA